MVHYRRNKVKGGYYFFTVTLRNRQSNLLIQHIDILRTAMKEVQGLHPYKTEAIVVLPEHLHVLWKLPEGDDQYAERLRCIKGLFTRGIIKQGIKIERHRKGEYKLWQSRYWEHTIKDEKDYEQHINYIHYNPVKHRLVQQVKDWQYSSFHRYVQKKTLPYDWSGIEIQEIKQGFGE